MESLAILDPRFRALVLPNAPLVKPAERLARLEGPGFADGFRGNEVSNPWSSAGDGVHCIDQRGAQCP